MKRFLKNLFKHPGTWMFGVSIAVLIGIFAPLAAPALMIAAAVSFGIGVLALIPYVMNFFKQNLITKLLGYSGRDNKLKGKSFFKKHPVQGIVLALTIGLFITALILTIGFFSGGAGFAFMGPIFAALSSPFAIAAASAHVSLFLPALAGFCFVMAPLVVGNNLKRFLGWLDSFEHDAKDTPSKQTYSYSRLGDIDVMRDIDVMTVKKQMSYFGKVFSGVLTTIQNDFSSPYQDKLESKNNSNGGYTKTYQQS